MGELIKTIASDEHTFDAYLAQPQGMPRGGIVLIHEIFGVDTHIKNVADNYAREGYLVGVPALFDRFTSNIELGYASDEFLRGQALKAKIGNHLPLKDIAATLNLVSSSGKVGLIGYGWGGTLAWLASCKVNGLACASAYYGEGIGVLSYLRPKCPVIFHFGDMDHSVPAEEIVTIKTNQPSCSVYVYPANHGFDSKQRKSFEPTSSRIAEERTLKHLDKHLG